MQSLLKMHGFANIQFSNPEFAAGNMAVIAKKPAIKQGGTSLNRKKAAPVPATMDENPWANLDGPATG